jgi:5-methylthioadenosine/S-adenosylhomocysteine deaminase
MFASNGVSVSSCPASNMKLASGVCPVPSYQNANVNVSLGTDGSTTNNTLDMIAEMRLLGLMQKINTMDPRVTPAQNLLDIVTINGAKAYAKDTAEAVKTYVDEKLAGLE